MNNLIGTREELLTELQKLNEENESLKISIINDKIKHKEIEDSLQDRAEYFLAIFENSSSAILIVEKDTSITMASDEVCKISGYSKDELTSMSWKEVIHPDDLNMMIEYNTRRFVNPNDVPKRYEVRMYHKSGELRYVILSTSLMSNQKLIVSFIDITDRKKTEESLKESEEKYRKLVDFSPNGIAIVNSGNYVYINPAGAKIYGASSPSEITGKSIYDFIPKEDEQYAREQIEKVEEGNATPIKEEIMLKLDGSKVEVELVGIPFTYQNNLSHFIVFRDISARKAYEGALLRSEMKYRTLYDSTSDAVILLDKKGFFDCNKMALKIFGYASKVEFCSIHPGNASPPVQPCGTDSLILANHMIDLALEQGSYFFEWMHKRADTGESFPTEVLLSEMILDGKSVLQAVVRDISERKQAEKALRESEEIFKQALDYSTVGICHVSLDGKFIRFNKAFENIIGYSAEEIRALTYNDITHPDDLHIGVTSLKRMLNGEITLDTFEKRYIRKDNKIIWVSISPALIMSDGIPKFFISNIIDITETKRAEESLLKLNSELLDSKKIIEGNLYHQKILVNELSESEAKLKEIIAEKDKFFSIIAHDLKSPFNGFLGLTKMMSEDLQSFSTSEIQTFSTSMRDSANNLYKLLENLLDWSRIQRGLIEFNPNNLLLSFYAEQSIEIQDEVALQKNITIVNNIDENVTVFADLPMLNTVFRNLISNAIKFTPRNGKIELGVNTSYMSPNVSKTPEVCIYVKDSGIGIDSEMIGKLFKIDQHVSRPGTEKEPSTGLGLILCKEFIEKHGGRIWVESEEGNGSTFFFTLPKGGSLE